MVEGADVTWRGSIGETALFGAAAAGHVDVVSGRDKPTNSCADQILLDGFGSVPETLSAGEGSEDWRPSAVCFRLAHPSSLYRSVSAVGRIELEEFGGEFGRRRLLPASRDPAGVNGLG